MTSHAVIEDVYDVDDDAVLPLLDELDGVTTVESGARVLASRCVDTTELALTRAGVTLRLRTGGDDDGWRLELPTARSHHLVRDPADGAAVPPQLRDLVRLHVRDEELTTVATLHTHRSQHQLLDGAGALLATVCEDVVTAESSGPLRTWREWTLETAGPNPAVRVALHRLLKDAGARRSTASAPLERALVERQSAPELRAKDSAALLVHARLAEQVHELVRGDPLVRAGAPSGVHAMRVATRRLRSNLTTFRPALDREVTDPLRDELTWLAGVLGVLRDSEVQARHLEQALEHLESEAPELVRGPVRAFVAEHAEAEQASARADVLETLESPRYAALVDRLSDLAADPPLSARAEAPVRTVLAPRLRRDAKRLLKEGASVLTGAAGPAHDERLHDVRKAARRVRYAAEPLVPAYGKDAARLVKVTKRVQAILGEHHDTVAARTRLRDLADLAARHGENAFTYGVLHEREQQRATRLEADAAVAWERLPTKKQLRWLA